MPCSKRAPRIDLRRPATLINSDGDILAITILDMSGDGFRIEVSEPLRQGEQITIVDGNIRAPAEIKWSLGNEAGAAFVGSTDFEV